MISVTDARKSYGTFQALDNVSLEIPSGTLTALLGPSGSGKSTLLRVIAGLEDLDAGAVVIAGNDVTRLPPQQRGIGFVFQHYAAFKHMTVRDNVAFGLTIRKRPKAEVAKRVGELLEVVGLAGFQHRYPAQLSGGQRQRMALARALAVDPQVLLLDEPFGALDAKVRDDLRRWLRRLHDELKVTSIFVTHDQEEAMEVADRVVLMNRGRVEQSGTPDEVYQHPASAFVFDFLGSANHFGHGNGEREAQLLYSRPHDTEIVPGGSQRTGHEAAQVVRILRSGPVARIELAGIGDPPRHFEVELSHEQLAKLALRDGQRVGLRPRRAFSVATEPGAPRLETAAA